MKIKARNGIIFVPSIPYNIVCSKMRTQFGMSVLNGGFKQACYSSDKSNPSGPDAEIFMKKYVNTMVDSVRWITSGLFKVVHTG